MNRYQKKLVLILLQVCWLDHICGDAWLIQREGRLC